MNRARLVYLIVRATEEEDRKKTELRRASLSIGSEKDQGSVHAQPDDQARLSLRRVAVVEDEDDLIPIYEYVIKSIGYKQEFVGHDGSDMVEAITTGIAHPDTIIMDYRMPNMNGLEAAQKIREVDKSVTIILATADDSVLNTAKEMGFQTIQKPFSISKLRELLRHRASG